jgi:photoactive yellow protein
MSDVSSLQFNAPDLGNRIDALTEAELDQLGFGVIGFDAETVVCLYNTFESTGSRLPRQKTVGLPLFTIVAPCMNNFMVAQRFEDAKAEGTVLDATLNYVLTLRMRPTKVQLRLLASPGMKRRYVLINRTV